MWIFTKHGFLAIVQHNSMSDFYQVKSRVIDPLEKLWPDIEIEIIHWADYRFRITIPKKQAISVIAEQMQSIDYTSYKNECETDDWFYSALTKIWTIMYNYQQKMEMINDEKQSRKTGKNHRNNASQYDIDNEKRE
ncbi:MAG: hypothetical protein CME10_06040 [Gemmatimonadetes bacterium]|nr:hypothetical protein [Gemmatimonadota bacterium]MBR50125.1 hypothetical protein [Euryarchaeota archaeon]|tara:strand:+ start:9641 stop:10048 length:408 start_codon:yes stop_codon:yes gene_type:complete